MYKKEVDSLAYEVSRDLRSSARSYYKIGIDTFHESRRQNWVEFQPAIGNLAISVELLLKSIIAKKAIRMLYSNLSDEAQLLLCYPESLSKEHNSRAYLSDLKGFIFKSIELDKCISLFYHFFPESKKEYKQFFSSLSTIRNVSIHASVPDFQRYELERISYFASKLFIFISQSKVFKDFYFKIEPKTINFIKFYKDEKIKKVKAALDTARKNVKNGKLSKPEIFSEDWESMHATCPICESKASYHGEIEDIQDDDGLHLEFQCESFTCESCGLKLEDYEELELASLETSLDRDYDVVQWATEHGYYYEE